VGDDRAGLDGLCRIHLHARLDQCPRTDGDLIPENSGFFERRSAVEGCAAAYDAARDACVGTDACPFHDDPVRDHGIVADDRVGSENGRRAYPRPGPDVAVVPDEKRTLETRAGVDLDVFSNPHARAELEPGDGGGDLAGQHVLLCLEVRIGGADVGPVRVRYVAKQR
jgi:hypothetical protein